MDRNESDQFHEQNESLKEADQEQIEEDQSAESSEVGASKQFERGTLIVGYEKIDRAGYFKSEYET